MSDFPYEDILYHPHHRSKKRIPMDVANRAAQFAPFAAVVGHREAVNETARYTDEKKELSEYEKEVISGRLLYIKEHPEENLQVEVTYFVPDEKKSGGFYHKHTGVIARIREFDRCIIFKDEKEIFIDDVLSIDSEKFDSI